MMELGLLTGGSEELVNQLNVGGILPALLVALLVGFVWFAISVFRLARGTI